MRTFLYLSSLCSLASLLACDSPTAPPDSPPVELPPPTGPISATITPAGGTLTATTDGGAVITVTIPGNAVLVPTEVTVRPLAADASTWFGLLLEPAGLRLHAPFDLKIVFPEKVELVDPVLLLGTADAAVPLATRFDPATRTLSTGALALFGLMRDVAAPNGSFGALAALNPGDGSNNRVSAARMSCSEITAAAQRTFDGFVADQKFEKAMAAVLSIGAVLQKANCDPNLFLEQARGIACERAQAAFDEVRNEPTTDFGEFARQADRIISWAELLQLLAADCTAASAWPGAIDQEIADFLAFFQERLDGLSANDYQTFLDLKKEALTLIPLRLNAILLGMTEAGDMVLEAAFRPALDRMRNIGYTLCRDEGWHYPLSRLTSIGFFAGRDIIGVDAPRERDVPMTDMTAGFSDQEIFADIQNCGTKLDVKSIVASGGTLAGEVVGTKGTPGSHVSELTLETPTRGSIRLAGDLRALTCWNSVQADTAIEVTLNGKLVRTLRRADDAYIGGDGLLLEIGELRDSAGITPQEGISHDLVFTRLRTNCPESLWGEPEYELLTITLDWVNPTLAVEIDYPETVVPGADHEAAVRVAVIDQLGNTAYFPDIDVALTVTGGSASVLSGRTDSTGYFRTSISAAAGGAEPVTIVAKARSFEGATAEAKHTAAIEGGMARFVRAFAHADVNAWLAWRQQVVKQEQRDTLTTPSAQISASATAAHDSVGHANASATVSHNVTLTADNRVVSANGTARSSIQIGGTSPHAGASAHGHVYFEVIGAAVTVHITGTVEGEFFSWAILLSLMDPDVPGRTLTELIRLDPYKATVLDTTVTLEPGLYYFGGLASNGTANHDRRNREGTVTWQMVVQ